MPTVKTELTEEQKQILEANPAAWVINIMGNMQAEQDREYNDKVTQFNNASTGWLYNAKIARGNGVVPPPFVMPIPQRVVFYPAIKSNPQPWFQVLEIDPTLQPPIAPPPITDPNKGNPIKTGAGDNTDMQNVMLTHILNDLDLIKKQMSIKG